MAARVFHCDDSEAFRVLIRELLHDEEGIELVGQAADAEAAVTGVGETRPDVVLLDLRGADLGPHVVARVQAVAPAARIIVLSGWPGPLEGVQVHARFDKDVDVATLAREIRAVAGKCA